MTMYIYPSTMKKLILTISKVFFLNLTIVALLVYLKPANLAIYWLLFNTLNFKPVKEDLLHVTSEKLIQDLIICFTCNLLVNEVTKFGIFRRVWLPYYNAHLPKHHEKINFDYFQYIYIFLTANNRYRTEISSNGHII